MPKSIVDYDFTLKIFQKKGSIRVFKVKMGFSMNQMDFKTQIIRF